MRVGTADTATEIRKEIISKREIFTRSVSLIVSEWDRPRSGERGAQPRKKNIDHTNKGGEHVTRDTNACDSTRKYRRGECREKFVTFVDREKRPETQCLSG